MLGAERTVGVTVIGTLSAVTEVATITVANGAANVAFLVRLRIVPHSGATPGAPDPAPVFFSANYLVLRRGETRVVLAEFAAAILNGAAPAVAWDFGGGGALS